jgi:hypothetical protein
MIDYNKFNLKSNPFDISFESPFMSDRKNEMKHLYDSLDAAFESKGSRFILILGNYGSGKTHMLNYLYSQFSNKKADHAEGVFVVKAHNDVLFEKPMTILETEPKLVKFGLSLICRIFGNIDPEKVKSALQRVPSEEIKGPYGKLFFNLSLGEPCAFRYIAGEKLTATELVKIGMPSVLNDSTTGLNVFFEWLRLLGLAKYHTQLILTDEFELIPQVLGASKVSVVLQTFRTIFDKSVQTAANGTVSAKPVFVFAASPEGWEKIIQLADSSGKKTGGGGIAPFLRRMDPRDRIDLGPFGFEDTKELVLHRLALNRIRATKQDDLGPFTELAIEYVHHTSFFMPANIIQHCSILIQDAILENLDKIDVDDAQRILGKYGIRATFKGERQLKE